MTANPEEMEFRDLLILVLKRSWIIAICALGAGWLGHHRSMKLPDQYRSTVLLIPSSATSGGQAALGPSSSGQNGRSAELSLYEAMMTSRTVMTDVLRSHILRSARDMAEVDVATFLHVDTSNSLAMQAAAGELSSCVRIDDGGEGIFYLSFTATDPAVAPQLADMVVDVTQKELSRIRSDKLRSILDLQLKAVDEAHLEYSRAAGRSAGYSASNVEMQNASLLMHKDELSSDVKVREEAYVTARQRADETRMELEQVYPPAVVFDPASRPAIRVGPDRRGQTMLWTFAGLVAGLASVLAWEFLLKKKPV